MGDLGAWAMVGLFGVATALGIVRVWAEDRRLERASLERRTTLLRSAVAGYRDPGACPVCGNRHGGPGQP